MANILLVGESWMSYTTHVKGFDSFTTTTYQTGEKWLKEALQSNNHTVEFMPNHIAAEQFPYDMEGLKDYDVVILSDIGANTLLLSADTFMKSIKKPNRCDLIKDYVLQGGALLMVGGYLTFSGIDAKGKWQDTSVSEVLPVLVGSTDDRSEHPEGIIPNRVKNSNLLGDLPEQWPAVLGYNKTILKEKAELHAVVGNDPLVATYEIGEGRTAVFTSDCSPHWAPPEFCEWSLYPKLWNNIINWLIS